jgi:hypothetical protein
MLDIPFELAQNNNFRILLQTPRGIRGLLGFSGSNDGSCFMICPKIFLEVDHYLSGGLVMPPRVKKIEKYDLTEENGFVKSEKPPKISFHPTGYIQSSFSTPKEITETSQLNMGVKLGDLGGKTIAHIKWENLDRFEESPKIKKKYKTFTIKSDKNINNMFAFLKCSYDLNDLTEGIKVYKAGKIISEHFEVDKKELKKLRKGFFIIVPTAILNKNKVMVGYGDELEKGLKPCKEPSISVLFGIRDQKNYQEEDQKIIWYLLSFIHPNDFKQTIIDKDHANFTFYAGMKNWEIEKTRESGEQIIIFGDKVLER